QPRQEQRHTRHVAIILARLVRAAQHNVFDLARRDAGPSHGLSDGKRSQVVWPHVFEGPAILAERRAHCRENYCFFHRMSRFLTLAVYSTLIWLAMASWGVRSSDHMLAVDYPGCAHRHPALAEYCREGSAALEVWLLLGEEGAHALLLVLAGEQQCEEALLMHEALLQRHLVCREDRLFDETDSNRGLFGDLARQLLRLLQVLALRDNAVDQPPCERLLGGDAPCCETELHRAIFA